MKLPMQQKTEVSDYKMPWLIDCWEGGDDEIVLDLAYILWFVSQCLLLDIHNESLFVHAIIAPWCSELEFQISKVS